MYDNVTSGSSMEKDIYIEREITKLLQSWGLVVLPAAAFIIGLLIILDYFVTPDHFAKFLIIRLISIFLFFTLFFLNKQRLNKKLQLVIAVLATVIVSSMVELMILSTGGHMSTYYVGMIITFIFIIGMLPISLKVTLLLASLIYGIYLLPVLFLILLQMLKPLLTTISFCFPPL